MSRVAVVCRRSCSRIGRRPAVMMMRRKDRARFRGFDRAAGSGGEDQLAGGPLVRRGAHHPQASLSVQRIPRYAEQRQITAASAGLDRAELEAATYAEQLLTDTDHALSRRRRKRRRWPCVSAGLCRWGGPPGALRAAPPVAQISPAIGAGALMGGLMPSSSTWLSSSAHRGGTIAADTPEVAVARWGSALHPLADRITPSAPPSAAIG